MSQINARVLLPPVDEDNVHHIALQDLGRRLVCAVHGNDAGSISQQNAMMAVGGGKDDNDNSDDYGGGSNDAIDSNGNSNSNGKDDGD